MVSTTQSNSRILAILGPTNTGKTHFAVERLLGHHNGVIGLPLRLLAREVYDKITAIKGVRAVALVTGEEKIVPANASYFVCTVESMPLGRDFDFLAVDEIQLCADPERGHVFTDRLLHARGRHETLFMGSNTIRSLIKRLVPEAEYVSRPRLSALNYAGPKKLSRLPRRSAIVAFSAADVYAVAELVRRQRGGAAVVMGALSPRTRNAQVAMYQAGEVDYLVATDAIGMGLNMAVEHIAFAGLSKFDGIGPRSLTAAEIGQIAGRAGRYLNDGTFGTTAEVSAMDPEVVEMVENHSFPKTRSLMWRNSGLAYGSIDALIRSLEAPPPADCLTRTREATDQMVLRSLAGDEKIAQRARGPAAVKLLWQVCQIPDFRKTMPDAHARLLGRIYSQLTTSNHVLDRDWVAGHLAALDRTDGDIDTLANRIAHVRTWTFISHRQDWLDDALGWQERARDLEDRLSDALHDRLTQRFVDRRTAVLARRLRDRAELTAEVDQNGEVSVEGHSIGTLDGLRFFPDRLAAGTEGRTVRAAAKRALSWEITRRARQLCQSDNTEFDLEDDGRLLWQGAQVAHLSSNGNILSPRLTPIADELLPAQMLDKVRRRLENWLELYIGDRMAPLTRLQEADLTGAARGIAYQLTEELGTCRRWNLNEQLRSLTKTQRQQLRSLGVRVGAQSVYLPALLKPERAALCRRLWAIHNGKTAAPPAPAPGLVSVVSHNDVGDSFYQAIGFRRLGPRAIRVDMVERLANMVRQLAKSGPFTANPELLSLVGCRRDEFPAIMQALGYRYQVSEAGELYSPAPVRQKKNNGRRRPKRNNSSDSPFAALKELPTG